MFHEFPGGRWYRHFFNWLKMVSHNTMENISECSKVEKKPQILWHGNSHLEEGPGVAGRCEWPIFVFPGPPSWFPHQFPSTSKSKPPEVQREKQGAIRYFGHRCFQLREDIKMFQEPQPLKCSNRVTSITDSAVRRTPSLSTDPFCDPLWCFRSPPLGTFVNSGVWLQPCWSLPKPHTRWTPPSYKHLPF